jgi:ABC-2 type transport system ATP-binding protein
LHDARAILFDEPLTGLDPHGIRIMKASIRERAARGAAFIVSSHLLSLIDDLCTHLLVLNEGRTLFSGTVDDARALTSSSDTAATLEESFFHIVRDAVKS